MPECSDVDGDGEVEVSGALGDEASFVDFCHAQHPRLVGALSLYLGEREVAHDLAQETLARLWRDRGRLRAGVRSPEAYAFRTAFNLAKNHLRWRWVRHRDRARLEREQPTVHHDPDAADAVAVRDAVAALPDSKRTALILRYFADQSVEQTASVMGIPQNSVKTLTRRALMDLRDELDMPVEESSHDG